MKTQVIQLEPMDDLPSTRDKMSWVKAERILLIVPLATNLNHQLDLVLLLRYSKSLGAKLGIVTHSSEIRCLCNRLGIPVFRTPSAARRGMWLIKSPIHWVCPSKITPRDFRKVKHDLPKINSYFQISPSIRIILFSLGVLAMMAVAWSFLPSATITYHPQVRDQDLTLTVRADPNNLNIIQPGSIPAYPVALDYHSVKTIPVQNEMLVSDAHASGSMRVSNLTESQMFIPANTIIRSLDATAMRFSTLVNATLGAGLEETVDIDVKALEGGLNGNLPAGSLLVMEGELGYSVSVTNPQSLTGGTEKMALVPSSSERSELWDLSMTSMQVDCQDALEEKVPVNQQNYLLPQINLELIQKTYFPAEGEPGDNLALAVDARCSGLVIDLDDLKTLATTSLDAFLPAGFAPFPGEIEVSEPWNFKTQQDGSVVFFILAKRPIFVDQDVASSQLHLIGKNLQQASAYLRSNYLLDGDPIIQTTPAWWKRMPFIPFRISIENESE